MRRNGNSDGLYFLGLQNHYSDCSHEIKGEKKKKSLLFGRKAMTNLESILKDRHTTLPIKVHIVKAIVFPVVMYKYKTCTIKRLSMKNVIILICGVGENS